MPQISVDGTMLAYVERGKGEPIVFVHGGMNDLRSWRGQMEAFGARFRAVALSCRHHHPNAPIPEGAELRLETHAEDLAAFLRALDLAPAHLVGSSSGAFVCLLLARREPGMVRSLVLAEPPVLSVLGVSVPPKPREMLKLLIRSPRAVFDVARFGATGIGPASRAFARGDDRTGLRTFIRGTLGREAAAVLPDSSRRQTRDNVGPLKAQLKAGLPSLEEAEATRIDVPTLLVTGENSAPVHHRITDVLERSMPRVERLDIRNASHLMHEDRPEAFNTGVLAFLSKLVITAEERR